ncbi:MAG TPA: DMT family transporter, partial [Chitinophagaceae bacterium]|nr:DMT family transporter [Chitinophagaceae bacterium]
MTIKQPITLVGFLLAFIGAILFSTKAIMVKLAFNRVNVDALTLLAIRMIFSLPFYLVTAFIVSRKEAATKLTAQQWLTVMVLGIFGYYLSSLFDFLGLQYISAGLERLILFLYPTFAVLISTFVFRQKMYRNQVIALVLTYFGIGIAYYGELRLDAGNPNLYWGSFLIFLCALTYGTYIAGSGKIIPLIGATRFTAYAMLTSTFGVLAHYALRGKYDALEQSMELWWYGILLAVVATVLPTFLISFALKKIGSNNVAIISSVGPISTIIQAHYFLGEKFFAEQMIG